MHQVLPFLGSEGVRRIHLWGVCYAPALGELLWLCDQWNIQLSTDSIGPQVRPVRGRWGYAEWTDTHYQRITQESDHVVRVKGFDGSLLYVKEARGHHRAMHVQQVRQWLQHFRSTANYPKEQPRWLIQPRQLKFTI